MSTWRGQINTKLNLNLSLIQYIYIYLYIQYSWNNKCPHDEDKIDTKLNLNLSLNSLKPQKTWFSNFKTWLSIVKTWVSYIKTQPLGNVNIEFSSLGNRHENITKIRYEDFFGIGVTDDKLPNIVFLAIQMGWSNKK
jgi:hypothetical protein